MISVRMSFLKATAKPVVDFHHQVIAHAGHTKKDPAEIALHRIILPYILDYSIIRNVSELCGA
ncbi:hypothetical protein SporoP32a_12380 [Sporosarcina ureae]|nr:hypothetical protein SporoP32a_12380 [Sporosarcina ureae]